MISPLNAALLHAGIARKLPEHRVPAFARHLTSAPHIGRNVRAEEREQRQPKKRMQ